MNTYKHSGTIGDLIYSLALVKHFGGGEFYLHLNQVDWIGMHYYGNRPTPFHQGRMTLSDYEFLRDFMMVQEYITNFKILDTSSEISHNLDKFRPLFVGHPTNYINTYCMAFGITDQEVQQAISDGPWLTVPNPKSISDKPYVINRTARGFTAPGKNPKWDLLKDQGADQKSIFVGLPEEYQAFKDLTSWNIDYYPTATLLELAEVIAGCQFFIGNQSSALTLAQGLRIPYSFEARNDLPIERNESYFPNHEDGSYF